MSDLARTSYKSMRYVLCDFVDGVDCHPANLTVEIVELFFATRTWAASTVRTRLGVIRPFLEWTARKGITPPGVAAELHGPKMKRALPRALTVAQVGRLLGHVPDARARLIVLLMAQGGLRVHEVAGVQLCDMDIPEKSLRVRGKGGVERDVYLSGETIDAIRIWLGTRGLHKGPLITSYRTGQAMTACYIGMLVSEWMSDAGINGSAHALRHTMATELLRNGAHIAVVQNALGHASLATTSRYLRVYDTELKTAMAGLSFDYFGVAPCQPRTQREVS